MKRLFLLSLSVVAMMMVFGQQIKKVSATFTYYAPETMSVEEAKRKALDGAKMRAIADEFGTILTQTTTMVESEDNGKSDGNFFSLTEGDVKGEWVETFGNPEYTFAYDNHLLIVTVEVRGSIRERVTSKIDFDARLLRNGTDQRFESTQFRNGDDMYLYFKSPEDGYLIVFLVDENAKNVYSILPYPKDSYSAFEKTANKEYVFFSRKEAPELQKANVTEYTMTCGEPTEINDIVVVFTSSKLQMPKLKSQRIGTQPPTLDYETFMKWRANAMKHDDNLTIQNLTLTVKK